MTSSNPDLSSGNGAYSSMKLDFNGFPVISQYDPMNGDLRLTRCYDPACVVAHSNIVDDGGVAADIVGMYTSLALDANEFPVISYYDFTSGDLKLAHCNDADCAGGDDAPVGVVDGSTNDRGQYSSLALDQLGQPVISYYDATSHRLLLTHCNDVDCAGGDDPNGVVNTGDTFGDDVGQYSSMALDVFDGFPTIAYYNATALDLKLVHCTNGDCTGPQTSVLVDGAGTNVGANLSMTLDLSSTPVISYYDADNLALAIARCDDVTCAVPTISEPLVSITGPLDTSIAMDNTANVAVVSYIDFSNPPDVSMRIVRCDDAACNTASSWTPETLVGELPANTSLVLDFNGNPTIARFDSSISKLTVVHCTDPLCTPHVRVISAP